MKTREINITYNLSEVNLVAKTGVLRIRQEHLSKGKIINVKLSNQLAGKIKFNMMNPTHKRAEKLVDVDFTSSLKSDDYKANPLKLVKFIKEGQEDWFKLQMVTDKGFYIKEYLNAMNHRVDEVVFKHWKKSQYIRFWTVDLNEVK